MVAPRCSRGRAAAWSTPGGRGPAAAVHRRAGHRQVAAGRAARGRGGAAGARGGLGPLLGGGRRAGVLALDPGVPRRWSWTTIRSPGAPAASRARRRRPASRPSTARCGPEGGGRRAGRWRWCSTTCTPPTRRRCCCCCCWRASCAARRILVVGAYRDAEARLTPEHRGAAGQDRPRGARCCRCRGWRAEDVAAWVRRGGRRPAPRGPRSCTGSPRGTRCSWSRRCGWGAGAGGAGHSGRPGRRARRAARRACRRRRARCWRWRRCWGASSRRRRLAATAGTSADQVHAALRRRSPPASSCRRAEPERFRFSHVLLRDRLYAELAPSARAACTARPGSALLAAGQDAAGGRPPPVRGRRRRASRDASPRSRWPRPRRRWRGWRSRTRPAWAAGRSLCAARRGAWPDSLVVPAAAGGRRGAHPAGRSRRRARPCACEAAGAGRARRGPTSCWRARRWSTAPSSPAGPSTRRCRAAARRRSAGWATATRRCGRG